MLIPFPWQGCPIELSSAARSSGTTVAPPIRSSSCSLSVSERTTAPACRGLLSQASPRANRVVLNRDRSPRRAHQSSIIGSSGTRRRKSSRSATTNSRHVLHCAACRPGTGDKGHCTFISESRHPLQRQEVPRARPHVVPVASRRPDDRWRYPVYGFLLTTSSKPSAMYVSRIPEAKRQAASHARHASNMTKLSP